MTTYDATFFNYVNSGAIRSAKRLLPLLLKELEIGSVLDVGCGQGAWLSIWKQLGVSEVTGIDGDYVNREHLLIDEKSFIPHNLAQGFDLQRRFDLVQSLEVAEHLPEKSASTFVASLVKHGQIVMFSAAHVGQGGDNHINEREYDYWRNLFSKHNYLAVDCLRPLIQEQKEIEPWYRYNTILYISQDRLKTLPDFFQRALVGENNKIPDISPGLYKIRKRLISLLPVAAVTRLAKIKEHMVSRARS